MLDLQQYRHPAQASLRHPDQPPFVLSTSRPFVLPHKPPSFIPTNRPFVILNSFQDNEIPLPVILKRVQDDEVVLFRMTGWCSSGRQGGVVQDDEVVLFGVTVGRLAALFFNPSPMRP